MQASHICSALPSSLDPGQISLSLNYCSSSILAIIFALEVIASFIGDNMCERIQMQLVMRRSLGNLHEHTCIHITNSE